MNKFFTLSVISSILITNVAMGQQMTTAQPADDTGEAEIGMTAVIDSDADSLRSDTAENPEPVTVVVNNFAFVGNELQTDADLSDLLAGYLNRPLTLQEFYQALYELEKSYREMGRLARATLPQQDVTAGIVTINILESVLSDVEITTSTRSPDDIAQIKAIFFNQQEKGTAVDLVKLGRAQLLADDLPGISVKTRLTPGQTQGTTAAIVQLETDATAQYKIRFDNHGNPSTGAQQTSAASVNAGLFTMGDKLTADYLISEGRNSFQADYSLPLGYDGWRGGVGVSILDYDVVSGGLSSLNANGTFDMAKFTLSYPIIRTKQKNLNFNSEIWSAKYQNIANTLIQTDYRKNGLKLSLSGNFSDAYFGGGANVARLEFTSGNSVHSALSNGKSASFTKLNFEASRIKPLSAIAALELSLDGQIATKSLESSEKFSLGGPAGVRAYPSNEGSGDLGYTAAVTLANKINPEIDGRFFFDLGRVVNFDAANYNLGGLGLGFDWKTPYGFDFKADLSRRIGDNPMATSSGADQDGTFVMNRLWFSVTYNF